MNEIKCNECGNTIMNDEIFAESNFPFESSGYVSECKCGNNVEWELELVKNFKYSQ